MREILDELHNIEKEYRVQIFYACESGSRAWGFPSADSDYDVRFLYVRERDWYLSIDVEDKRDVIELPINHDLDISGWDLRKALKLLRKSNPPLLEWLSSPTVYLQDDALIRKFRDLAPLFYSPTSCCYHYLQMARNNFREYLKGDTVKIKKYFYVLRPILAIKWIEECSEIMPMEFGIMVDRLISDPSLKQAINNLIERKKQGEELKLEPKIPVISDFIEREMERVTTKVFDRQGDKHSVELLNSAFREMISMSRIGHTTAHIQ
jgi:predicted nucleotidyltransferase